MTAASDRPNPPPPAMCPTRVHYSTPPADLATFAQAAAELATTPHPMSERDLRRRYKAYRGRRIWQLPRQDGSRRLAEYVSMSDIWEFHRNLFRGWLARTPRQT